MRTAPGTDPVKLKGLKIEFLSPVTRPAHEGADALLLKTADFDEAAWRKRRHTLTDKDKMKAMRRKPKNPCEKKAADNPCEKKRRRSSKTGCGAGAAAIKRALATKSQDADLDDGDGFECGLQEFAKAYDELVQEHEHADQLAKFEEDSVPAVMTSSLNGHSHLVHFHGRAGTTTWQKSEGEENGHDHPFMLTMDDVGGFTLEIGDAEGHSHGVEARSLNAAFAAAAMSKIFEEDDMPDPTKTSKTETEALDNLALARLFMGFNDSERTHFQTLGAAEKAAFVGKTGDERQAEIRKAAGPEEVLYKDRDGHTYTEADDPRAIATAKRADDAVARAEKSEKTLNQERLEKRADAELGHLPGSAKSRAALLAKVESIEDEAERGEAMAALTAGNEAIGRGFQQFGTSGGADPQTGSAADKIDKLAEKYAADNSISVAKAYDHVTTKTEEGRALYKDTLS